MSQIPSNRHLHVSSLKLRLISILQHESIPICLLFGAAALYAYGKYYITNSQLDLAAIGIVILIIIAAGALLEGYNRYLRTAITICSWCAAYFVINLVNDIIMYWWWMALTDAIEIVLLTTSAWLLLRAKPSK